MKKSLWIPIILAVAGAFLTGRWTDSPVIKEVPIEKTNDSLQTAYLKAMATNKDLETQRDGWRKQASLASVEIAKKNEIISHTKPETTKIDGTVYIHDTVKVQSDDILSFSFPSKAFPWLKVGGFAYERDNRVEGEVYSSREMFLTQDRWLIALQGTLFRDVGATIDTKFGKNWYGIGINTNKQLILRWGKSF